MLIAYMHSTNVEINSKLYSIAALASYRICVSQVCAHVVSVLIQGISNTIYIYIYYNNNVIDIRKGLLASYVAICIVLLDSAICYHV